MEELIVMLLILSIHILKVAIKKILCCLFPVLTEDQIEENRIHKEKSNVYA